MPEKSGLRKSEALSLPGLRQVRKLVTPFRVAADVEGCRKVRWSVAGSGKRGGVRVIYFTKLANGEIWLLVIYKKAVRGNIPAHILKSIREVLENE